MYVLGKIRDLILDYYSRLSLRVTSGTVSSTFHWLEKGIITGCTVSVILFALAMNMLVKSAEVEKCRHLSTHQDRCAAAPHQRIHR